MGILLGHGFRIGNLHVRQHFHRLFRRFLLAHSLMDDEGLGNLAFDGEHRVQAGHGLLENNGNGVAAHFVHFRAAELGHIRAVEEDFSAFDPAVGIHQIQNTHGGDALTGAGFTHNAQRTAGVHGIAHAVDGLDDAAPGVEIRFQILDFQQRHSAHLLSVRWTWDPRRRADRRPSD